MEGGRRAQQSRWMFCRLWPGRSERLPSCVLLCASQTQVKKKGDPFEVFQKSMVKAVNKYTGAENLVGSMARKVKTVCEKNTGEMLDD